MGHHAHALPDDLEDEHDEEAAGWEAAVLAEPDSETMTAAAPPEDDGALGAALPDWGDHPPEPPPSAAPPGWQGTAVVGVLAEEAECEAKAHLTAEAEFGAALLSMPLDGDRPRAPRPPRRRRSESSASDEEGPRSGRGQDARGRGRGGPHRRRVSFDLSATGGGAGGALDGEPPGGTVACRRHGCGVAAPEATARLRFKTCHNCAHTYCSRECRREHWDSHKRACAVQRVGGLLRRVVARVRQDTAAVSAVARRGYAEHGRGAVRLLFHSADAAEAYCAAEAGAGPHELVFLRWADLPAGELGGSLHEDLARLCRTYNPRTRAVTLVVLEVLSEAPSDDGVVMWERQLVSRVFKVPLFREDRTLVLVGMLAPRGEARDAVVSNILRALAHRGLDLADAEHSEARRRVLEFVEQCRSRAPPLAVEFQPHDGGNVTVLLVPGSAADATPQGSGGGHSLAASLGRDLPDGAETIDVSFNGTESSMWRK